MSSIALRLPVELWGLVMAFLGFGDRAALATAFPWLVGQMRAMASGLRRHARRLRYLAVPIDVLVPSGLPVGRFMVTTRIGLYRPERQFFEQQRGLVAHVPYHPTSRLDLHRYNDSIKRVLVRGFNIQSLWLSVGLRVVPGTKMYFRSPLNARPDRNGRRWCILELPDSDPDYPGHGICLMQLPFNALVLNCNREGYIDRYMVVGRNMSISARDQRIDNWCKTGEPWFKDSATPFPTLLE